MDRIRIAMCDDEETALGITSSGVFNAFRQHNAEVDIHRFLRADRLLASLRTQGHAYHIVMLDIKMPGADGIQVAREIRTLLPDVTIVFISSKEERVFEAFEVNAFFFIRKSRLIEDISAFAVHYLQAVQAESAKRVISFPQNGATISLYPADILCVESEGRRQKVHIQGKDTPLELNLSLQSIEEELADERFLRVHKGFIVNNDYISRISGGVILLKNGMEVPISRRKLKEIQAAHMKLTRQRNTMLR